MASDLQPSSPLPAALLHVTNDPGQVVHTHVTCASIHQAIQIGTGHWAVRLCGWEGNRRSGVALAMRHRLGDPPPTGSMAWEMGDEHPT